VHAAEETITDHGGAIGKLLYPEFTALCGQKGWGDAGGTLADVNCKRCKRTNRLREALMEGGHLSHA